MKENLTDITVVLDRSGSMGSVRDDTIGGFNTFLEGQKSGEGEATISLVQFDHEYTPVYEGWPIAKAEKLDHKTYEPRGMTALLDALGRTIVRTGTRLEAMKEEDRPAKVVFVVITDGYENASREFDREKIADMIQRQTDIYNWQFVYLGANQDAITVGKTMGFSAQTSATYSVENTVGTFSLMDSKLKAFRRSGAVSRSLGWTAEDRAELTNEKPAKGKK